jgi:hypothetical protein
MAGRSGDLTCVSLTELIDLAARLAATATVPGTSALSTTAHEGRT